MAIDFSIFKGVKMKGRIITENIYNQLRTRYDDERFAIVQTGFKEEGKVIIINPREAQELRALLGEFIGEANNAKHS